MTEPQTGANTRAAAAKAIFAVLRKGESLNTALPHACAKIAERDQPLVRELCFGVTRLYPQLSGIVDQLLKKPLREKDLDVYALLLLGVYQLSYTRIPDHAAIAETVKAATILKKHWAKSFINGVLRQYQRRIDSLNENLDEAGKTAHPQWLLTLLQERWPEQIDEIITANNGRGPMTIRVNPRHSSIEGYLRQLEQQEIAAHACLWAKSAIRLEEPCNVDQLPGFSLGHSSVQDEAAQLAAELVMADKPDRVLDACCAPGGKTGHILELASDNCALDALDISEERIQRVKENLHRLELNAHCIVADALQVNEWWDGIPYDAILLDAPCSATGVIRRHPDIKLLRKPQDIAKLAAMQQALLNALWPCLKPGGTLVYATCSVLPDENTQTVAQFIANTDDAEHRIIAEQWGMSQQYGRQLLPQLNGPDGFYYACITKHNREAASS
ncbi:MAG: 16S rRNA (cytosine(967)-C(5))-methyltransferase RsmB [Pseudomonadales bacterium]